jgi:uncharacterized membrane protein YhaH (DUF805 family)
MENSQKFGAIDRYFSIKNEKRIWRLSFFLRAISITIMTALLWMGIWLWMINIFWFGSIGAWPVMIIVLTIILVLSVPILAKKRSHDFNSKGEIASYILYSSLGLNFVLNFYNIYLSYTGDFGSILEPNMFIVVLNYISLWLSLASLIVLLVLLFRPWTSWENNYWK